MRLTANDDMIQAFAADRPDQPFGQTTLPRRGWRGRLVPDAHGAQSACDDGTIDAILSRIRCCGHHFKEKPRLFDAQSTPLLGLL